MANERLAQVIEATGGVGFGALAEDGLFGDFGLDLCKLDVNLGFGFLHPLIGCNSERKLG